MNKLCIYNGLLIKGCNDDEYECEDGACIKLEQVCDGVRDCHAGDDEALNCSELNNATYTENAHDVYTEPTTDYLGTTIDYNECK